MRAESMWAPSSSVFRLAVEVVVRLDEAYGARRRAHDHRVGDRATADVSHAGEIVAGCHTGCRTHHHARGELLERVLALQIEEAEGTALAGLELVPGPQPRLHLASKAAQRRRRDDALRRASGAEEQVDAGLRHGGGEGCRDVA